MTPGKVENELKKFITSILFTREAVKNLMDSQSETISELGVKLSKVLNKKEEVEEYLDFVIDEMESYRTFAKGSIPYSKLFYFANKDKRISEFLMDKKISEKRKTKITDMAGLDEDIENFCINDAETEIKGRTYGCIHVEDNHIFWFNPENRKVMVQLPSGEIVSNKEYVKKSKNENSNYIRLAKIFKKIKHEDRKGHYLVSFLIYWKQRRTKRKKQNEKGKGKKKK